MREAQITVVAFGSDEYQQTVRLRNKVLRAPLGLSLGPEELAAESSDVHIACFIADQLAGCLVLTPKNPETVKMRQVAVSPSMQRQGIGRLLVRASEEMGRERGFSEMVLHARDVAVPFYLILGYNVLGEPFEELGITHRAMSKTLFKNPPGEGTGPTIVEIL